MEDVVLGDEACPALGGAGVGAAAGEEGAGVGGGEAAVGEDGEEGGLAAA